MTNKTIELDSKAIGKSTQSEISQGRPRVQEMI